MQVFVRPSCLPDALAQRRVSEPRFEKEKETHIKADLFARLPGVLRQLCR